MLPFPLITVDSTMTIRHKFSHAELCEETDRWNYSAERCDDETIESYHGLPRFEPMVKDPYSTGEYTTMKQRTNIQDACGGFAKAGRFVACAGYC